MHYLLDGLLNTIVVDLMAHANFLVSDKNTLFWMKKQLVLIDKSTILCRPLLYRDANFLVIKGLLAVAEKGFICGCKNCNMAT